MKFKRTLCLFALIVAFLVISNMNTTVLAKKTNFSPIDFSGYSPKGFYVDLDGTWDFFEKELLTPIEVQSQLNKSQAETVSLPSSFETQTGDINSFGTYSTMIKIPEELVGETLAIHIPYQYSAYTLFVNHSEIARTGVVGKDSDSHIAEMAPRTGYFIAQSDEVQLTMQVSSFNHIRGGFENSIYLGDASIVAQRFNTNMLGTLFINGSIFIIGLFMILFAWYRRQESMFFIFGVFAMLISARSLFTVPFYYTLVFDMAWVWGTRLEYILTEASSMFFVILLWKWHEEEFSKKIMSGLVVIHAALIIATLFTQPVVFQALFFNVFYLAIPTFFYVIYVIYKSIRNKNKYAQVNLIGMGLIFLAFFNDFAIGNNWYQGATLMLPAVGIYVFIHVIMMSKNFADSVEKTEEQNRQLLALNASNEQLAVDLQQEIKRKDDFLANTSHELRNPLHGILAITQSILRNKSSYLNEKVQNDLALQLTIGHHMSQTLEDLLDITRLKEHRIRLFRERLDLLAVTKGVVEMLNVLIEPKKIQIDIRIPNDFPRVAADKARVIQILFNLLHNAVKFTEVGTITVDAGVPDGNAHIHVRDTGIGINEKKLRTIFKPYEQDDSSMTAIGGGLGLGLSICKQLVELHGGTIKASSVYGEGSEFTFTLPLADSSFKEEIVATFQPPSTSDLPFREAAMTVNAKMVEAFTHNKPVPSLNRPRILAVDDDPVNLKVLTNILSDAQYEVKTVTSGKEALKQLEQEKWDLIISDVMMPEMSGYELTRSIREKYSISELPVLLLTARSNPEDIYTGFLAGASDYVTKPVDALELNVRVHMLTDLQTSINERLWMEAAWLQAQIRPHFLLNTLNAIISLSEIDRKRMVRLLEEFAHYLQSSFYLKNLDKRVPLNQELDLLKSYLYIEKERFGDRLQIKWEIDDVTGVMIPPLSLQTLVENAVNHGILKQMDGGLITIRVRKKDRFTEISVIDNGVGMDEEKIKDLFTIKSDRKKGIGLINTEQRLKRLYGKGLHINSTPGVGTTITFAIPTNT